MTAQSRANGLLGPQLQPAYQAYTAPQSTTLNLHPVIHVPNYMDHYSFTDPWGMDGWVGHVGWPIADGLTARSLIQLAVWRRIGKVRRDQRSNHYATVATLPTAYMCCDLPPHHSREWAISVLRAVAFGVCALSSGVRVWLTYDFFSLFAIKILSALANHTSYSSKRNSQELDDTSRVISKIR